MEVVKFNVLSPSSTLEPSVLTDDGQAVERVDTAMSFKGVGTFGVSKFGHHHV